MYPRINRKATSIRLRRIMDCQKITVKDVQQYLDLSCVQGIYRWLNGRSMPTVDNLYALSELFQMPLDQLVVGTRRYPKPTGRQLFHRRMSAYYSAMRKRRAVTIALVDCKLNDR